MKGASDASRETDARRLEPRFEEGSSGSHRRRDYLAEYERAEGWGQPSSPQERRSKYVEEVFEEHLLRQVRIAKRMSALVEAKHMDAFKGMVLELIGNWEFAEDKLKGL